MSGNVEAFLFYISSRFWLIDNTRTCIAFTRCFGMELKFLFVHVIRGYAFMIRHLSIS
ncbi:MAG: hypothetical protein N838_29615 [Thiohalocapsa sp. PB-PSB1]|nr:MAG: hypothetical protein N838_29615 [Thiohalocapsa sp. PB-PSB1]